MHVRVYVYGCLYVFGLINDKLDADSQNSLIARCDIPLIFELILLWCLFNTLANLLSVVKFFMI
jgi:hypothetical protein